MEKKNRSIIITTTLTTLLSLLAIVAMINNTGKALEIRRERDALGEQQKLIDGYKLIHDEIPKAESYNDIKDIIKGEFHYWPEVENSKWEKFYEYSEVDFILTAKKEDAFIVCSHHPTQCTQGFYK